MKTIFFLQGPSGTGKSSALRDILTPHIRQTAGFTVQRLLENGVTVGFRAIYLDGNALSFPSLEAVYTEDADNIFILRGKWLGAEVLENMLEKTLLRAQSPDIKMILLDEIGGIEMLSAKVMETLEKILNTDKPCYGVLKSKENLERTIFKLGLSIHKEELLEKHERLEKKILPRSFLRGFKL